jgi:two-component system chemotaxis sensor kinase CheA
MPLIRVSDLLGTSSPPLDSGSDKLQVIVSAEKDGYLGLVVDGIDDIVEQEIALERSDRDARILGSAVIQQRVTDVLDLDRIIAGREMERAAAAPQGA